MSPRLLLTRLTTAFWAIPAAGAVGSGLLALLTAWVDREYGDRSGVLYGGGPDSARTILQTVATSVLTFAGLTFSITVVALQLASSQFSPRVLSSLMRDRWTQGALATFVGTFVYALLMLREVRGGEESFVPGLGVGVTLLLGLASIAALVGFIHHMVQSLRVVTIIERIASETREALDGWYADEPVGHGRVVQGGRHVLDSKTDGVLAWYDRDALVGLAVQHDLTVELLVPSGAWVVAGRPVMALHGAAEPDVDLPSVVGLGRERETVRDPSYGFRQLVDIAERALSPGVNDPTTALQCVDRMHALLARIVDRDLAVGDTVVDGVVRLRLPVPRWEDYLGLACDEIRHWGADSLRVHRRLEAMLRHLESVAPAERVEPVRRQLEALMSRREGAVAQEWDRFSTHGDPAEVLGRWG